jgi:hypothetical protein
MDEKKHIKLMTSLEKFEMAFDNLVDDNEKLRSYMFVRKRLGKPEKTPPPETPVLLREYQGK